MPKLTEINSANINLLRNELNQALRDIANRYGVDVSIGSGRYTATAVKFELAVAVKNSDGVALTVEAETLAANIRYYKLPADVFAKPFTHGGETYLVTGYIKKNSAKPFQIKRLRDGNVLKCPSVIIRQAYPATSAWLWEPTT